jgi:MFS family permease
MLSSAIYGLFYAYIGWRGMLWVGVLPALSVFYVRKFVLDTAAAGLLRDCLACRIKRTLLGLAGRLGENRPDSEAHRRRDPAKSVQSRLVA